MPFQYPFVARKKKMKIIGISGSSRNNSYNAGLIIKAQQLLTDSVDFETLDIAAWPMYNQDMEAHGVPAEILSARELIKQSDGVILSTPEHNYSISALLKNAIDWLSRPPQRSFFEKSVLIVGASPGAFGSVRAQGHLRDIMHALNANVFLQPQLLVTNVKDKVDAGGILTDQKTIETYQQILNLWTSSIVVEEKGVPA
ncbi:MAG: NAD(P)H-dependent oxidoreductase [Ignavibacteria bacterium]|nr:NAD(P)H-dependent oxidoreductase [Ignavibacteria bacterium]